MNFRKIPEGYDSICADEKKVIIYSCPICHDEINLNKENNYEKECKCGYKWRPTLFGCGADVKINELIEIKYGIWADYKNEE